MVGAHRAFYTSYGLNTDPTFQTYFEPLFLKYHVDIIFTGHIHVNIDLIYATAKGVL